MEQEVIVVTEGMKEVAGTLICANQISEDQRGLVFLSTIPIFTLLSQFLATASRLWGPHVPSVLVVATGRAGNSDSCAHVLRWYASLRHSARNQRAA
ncbi:hypothetical protein Pla144_33350 [Bythopirellula polymerisocia]|uniref:Uncharacterized protein n=1 Tax=Bythopirellula polymerisocia TaxID=2528003 RepID=A0A5C6CP06_9BACT|nr:hypothetical protein Pla144_33350 [Bythopirellula polymerisocia]